MKLSYMSIKEVRRLMKMKEKNTGFEKLDIMELKNLAAVGGMDLGSVIWGNPPAMITVSFSGFFYKN